MDIHACELIWFQTHTSLALGVHGQDSVFQYDSQLAYHKSLAGKISNNKTKHNATVLFKYQ